MGVSGRLWAELREAGLGGGRESLHLDTPSSDARLPTLRRSSAPATMGAELESPEVEEVLFVSAAAAPAAVPAPMWTPPLEV